MNCWAAVELVRRNGKLIEVSFLSSFFSSRYACARAGLLGSCCKFPKLFLRFVVCYLYPWFAARVYTGGAAARCNCSLETLLFFLWFRAFRFAFLIREPKLCCCGCGCCGCLKNVADNGRLPYQLFRAGRFALGSANLGFFAHRLVFGSARFVSSFFGCFSKKEGERIYAFVASWNPRERVLFFFFPPVFVSSLSCRAISFASMSSSFSRY